MLNKQLLREDVISIKNKINKVPNQRDYIKHGKYCIGTFIKYFGSWRISIKEIFNIDRPPTPKKIRAKNICPNCLKETKNPKFCSQKCAAIYNNKNGKIGRKRIIHTSICARCNSITSSRRLLCDFCRKQIKTNDNTFKNADQVTKKDVSSKNTQKYDRIRKASRVLAKDNGLLKKCYICGYDKHVECCHKKPISSFSNDTLISVINNVNNLVGLCRNHHWELDHNLLVLDEGFEPT